VRIGGGPRPRTAGRGGIEPGSADTVSSTTDRAEMGRRWRRPR
jgi:hypothetical protein